MQIKSFYVKKKLPCKCLYRKQRNNIERQPKQEEEYEDATWPHEGSDAHPASDYEPMNITSPDYEPMNRILPVYEAANITSPNYEPVNIISPDNEAANITSPVYENGNNFPC